MHHLKCSRVERTKEAFFLTNVSPRKMPASLLQIVRCQELDLGAHFDTSALDGRNITKQIFSFLQKLFSAKKGEGGGKQSHVSSKEE